MDQAETAPLVEVGKPRALPWLMVCIRSGDMAECHVPTPLTIEGPGDIPLPEGWRWSVVEYRGLRWAAPSCSECAWGLHVEHPDAPDRLAELGHGGGLPWLVPCLVCGDAHPSPNKYPVEISELGELPLPPGWAWITTNTDPATVTPDVALPACHACVTAFLTDPLELEKRFVMGRDSADTDTIAGRQVKSRGAGLWNRD